MTQSQTAQTQAFTAKELQFLHTMTQSDFYLYEIGVDSVLWDYSVNELLPYSGKTRSGVISSLAQKDIIVATKKEKGDIAGTYNLTKHAKSLSMIQSIFN